MPQPGWEDRWPGRLEWELQALRDMGISFEVDQDAWDRGVLQLNVPLNINGKLTPAVAVYPDYFPDFRPRVHSEGLHLTHHQNPFSGDLCLLGRAGDQWQPKMTLADLLTQMLPKALAAGATGVAEAILEAEDPQAEPFSAYYYYIPGSAVLVDGDWNIPEEVSGGTLIFGFHPADLPVTDATLEDGSTFPAPRCAVLEVRSASGHLVASCDPAIRALYRGQTVVGRWVRRSEPSREMNPARIFRDLDAKLASYLVSQWTQTSVRSGTMRMLGILFPEETGHRVTGWGWVFGVERTATGRTRKNRAKKQRVHEVEVAHAFYARAVYAGRSDTTLRIPALAPLRERTVAVFGLGSLGAPAAIELAKAGVGELRLLDGDHVEAGPTARWPLGLRVIGENKSDALEAFIREHYPYTRVRGWTHRIGVPRSGGPSDAEVLDQMLHGASLVLDATAEMDVERLLARTARERGIPYVAVVGKPGAWGGMIFRQMPGPPAGCWNCLLLAQKDRSIPHPPGDFAPGPQARGCAEPTFTGAGFDMATLALDAVRKTVGTLCRSDNGYPEGDWDVAIVAFRSDEGAAIPPTWRTFQVPQHPECRECTRS